MAKAKNTAKAEEEKKPLSRDEIMKQPGWSNSVKENAAANTPKEKVNTFRK